MKILVSHLEENEYLIVIYEELGKEFKIVSNITIKVIGNVELVDTSFDHEFGTEYQYSYEISKDFQIEYTWAIERSSGKPFLIDETLDKRIRSKVLKYIVEDAYLTRRDTERYHNE